MSFRTFLVQLLSLFFGLVYPAYGSIAAIESNTGEDDTHWLIYWLIFSIVTIVESLLWPVLKWVPLYGELKVSVLAWLVLPGTKGALWVYEAILSRAIAQARIEIAKFPAAQETLAKFDRSAAAAPAKARSDTENAAEISRRKTRLSSVVGDVSTAFESDLKRIEGIVKPKERHNAEAAFDKGLTGLSKLAAARQAGSNGKLFPSSKTA